MKNLWFFFLVVLSAGSISEKLFVMSETVADMVDDLYIEDLPSGDSPVDDEGGDDDGSGSGSGDYPISEDFKNIRTVNLSWVSLPSEALPTAEPPHTSPTTAAGGPGPARSAEVTKSSFSDDRNVVKEMPGMDSTSNYIIDITTTTPFSISASSESNWDVSLNYNAFEDELTKEVDNNLMAEAGRRGRMNEMSSTEGVTSENLWDRTDVLAAVIACGVVGFLCAVSLLLLLAYRMKKKDEGSYDLGDIKLSATAYHKAPTKEFYA